MQKFLYTLAVCGVVLMPSFAFAETTVAPEEVPQGVEQSATSECTVNGEPVDCSEIMSGVFAILGGVWLVFIALFVLMLVSMWKIYVKAGQPGWASLIPIYNIVIMLRIAGKPEWWVILLFIPFVGIVFSFIIAYHFVKVFGKGIGFCLGAIFLPFIFYPILAFGKATYRGPAALAATPPVPPAPAGPSGDLV